MADPGEAGRPGGPPGGLNDQYAPYVVSPLLIRAYAGAEALGVIIDVSFDYPGGSPAARQQIEVLVGKVEGKLLSLDTRQHVFARLTLDQVKTLVASDGAADHRAIYKIWPDKALEPHLDRSVKVIKADACVRAFGSEGAGIVWAVIDSGIDGAHPHFATYQTLDLAPQTAATPKQASLIDLVAHRDFTGDDAPLTDVFGHGTHVAGIIAGATPCDSGQGGMLVPAAPGAVRLVRRRDESDSVRLYAEPLHHPLTGVAPRCKLVSLKVLDASGAGGESALLAALDYVDQINADGDRIRVHGVNISIGYPFEAEWFAAGQSPVCVAVNRLVSHNVVVVVSAGNEGSVLMRPDGAASLKRIGLSQSIADPGNADLAITVGSTHPESPHTFGVSYFSSRGPTADGRAKPDLVAPGERIISCAAAATVETATNDPQLDDAGFVSQPGVAYYREESGTSMAAPHVSGACASFLSTHREFIGQPAKVKAALVNNATDLGRTPAFQGSGLLDLLRAIQAV